MDADWHLHKHKIHLSSFLAPLPSSSLCSSPSPQIFTPFSHLCTSSIHIVDWQPPFHLNWLQNALSSPPALPSFSLTLLLPPHIFPHSLTRVSSTNWRMLVDSHHSICINHKMSMCFKTWAWLRKVWPYCHLWPRVKSQQLYLNLFIYKSGGWCGSDRCHTSVFYPTPHQYCKREGNVNEWTTGNWEGQELSFKFTIIFVMKNHMIRAVYTHTLFRMSITHQKNGTYIWS